MSVAVRRRPAVFEAIDTQFDAGVRVDEPGRRLRPASAVAFGRWLGGDVAVRLEDGEWRVEITALAEASARHGGEQLAFGEPLAAGAFQPGKDVSGVVDGVIRAHVVEGDQGMAAEVPGELGAALDGGRLNGFGTAVA
jgi:hypothetical protein